MLVPCVTVDKDYRLLTHPPNTLWPVSVGLAMLVLSAAAFALQLWHIDKDGRVKDWGGLDLTRVREENGILSTHISGCEIRVIEGRIEEYRQHENLVVVLPCNEFFDDDCAGDPRTALGAYAKKVFEGQIPDFKALIGNQSRQKLGTPVQAQRTDSEWGESFGPGKCLLLTDPLNHKISIALVSTTTQKPRIGLTARISHLFDAMRELNACLADARIDEVAMPILGAGHGGIDPPLAFVGLLLAVAEAARYGDGVHRLKSVTVVAFKKDGASVPEVDKAVVRRALALIGSRD